MSTTSPSPITDNWTDLILTTTDATATWQGIFARLRDLALADPGPVALHRQTVVPDRLLAEAAWNLWEDFPRCAPTVVDELKQFWVKSVSAGSAVLILDGLSLRELPMIVSAGRDRGIEPLRIEVRGSEVPTETERFAQAFGLPGRSKLYNNHAPASFIFSGPDVYTDLFDQPFADCVSSLPSSPRVFIWHKWPDEPLIHLHEDKKDGPSIVAADTKKLLTDDAFWSLVDRLRRGRRRPPPPEPRAGLPFRRFVRRGLIGGGHPRVTNPRNPPRRKSRRPLSTRATRNTVNPSRSASVVRYAIMNPVPGRRLR